MPSYDAVLSHHLNPLTCGVAKFNHQLARHLGVPCVALPNGDQYRWPLISIKTAEIGAYWALCIPPYGDLLLHDRPDVVPNRRIVYADELGCPATLEGNPTRGRYRVLTFGMAHKRILHHYHSLRAQLEAEHPDYTVEMSTAIHEGTPWEAGHEESIQSMRAIFGDKLRVLGFLGDDALAKELQECDAVAVYFEPAFRANNTSAWAAVAAGKTLYTNRDAESPADLPTWPRIVQTLTTALAPVTAWTIPASSPETRSESPGDRRDEPARSEDDQPNPAP